MLHQYVRIPVGFGDNGNSDDAKVNPAVLAGELHLYHVGVPFWVAVACGRCGNILPTSFIGGYLYPVPDYNFLYIFHCRHLEGVSEL